MRTNFSKRQIRRSKSASWWGLYALIPLTALLLVLAARVKMGEAVHQMLLVAIVVVVAVLAFAWSEQHADLMGSEGVDADAEASELTTAGIEPGRFAPSLTTRQAHYRRVMFARQSPETSEGRHLPKHRQ